MRRRTPSLSSAGAPDRGEQRLHADAVGVVAMGAPLRVLGYRARARRVGEGGFDQGRNLLEGAVAGDLSGHLEELRDLSLPVDELVGATARGLEEARVEAMVVL